MIVVIYDETMSAVFSSTMETTMEWTAADMIEGEESFGFSCEGADCINVGEMIGMPSDCTSHSLWGGSENDQRDQFTSDISFVLMHRSVVLIQKTR